MLDVDHTTLLGIQTHLHISKLRRERAESYPFWQCPHSWDDSGYTRFNCIHCYSGQWSDLLSCCLHIRWFSFAFPWCHRLFFRGQTQPRIQRGSMVVSLISLMTPMKRRRLVIFWRGGIGEYSLSVPLLNLINSSSLSQIFPNHSSARRLVCKNSALVRIKEKRAELKAAARNGRLNPS